MKNPPELSMTRKSGQRLGGSAGCTIAVPGEPDKQNLLLRPRGKSCTRPERCLAGASAVTLSAGASRGNGERSGLCRLQHRESIREPGKRRWGTESRAVIVDGRARQDIGAQVTLRNCAAVAGSPAWPARTRAPPAVRA
jgi:hypothetical protein